MLDADLERQAEREQSTKPEIAQKALQDYLARKAVKPTRQQLEEYFEQNGVPAPESFAAKAAKYIGIASGGDSDLSTNLQHLKGFGE